MINGLPQKLKELRIKFGYSQKQVAARLGVSPSIVSGYETGERTPSTEVLLSISYLYNCTTDYLLGRQAVDPQSAIARFAIDVKGLSDRQVAAISNLVDTLKNP